MTGTRDGAIERAENYFDNGGFQSDLQRRVAIPTTSQEEGSMPAHVELLHAFHRIVADGVFLQRYRDENDPTA